MKRRLALAVAGLTTTALVATPTVSMAEPGATSAPPETNFQKVTLNDHPGEPMDLAVLPDSRVLHVTRPGEVWLHDRVSGRNTVAATLDVYRHDEEGLQNVAIDPNFGKAGNNWVYLYYSPPMNTPVDDPSTPNVNEGDAPGWGTAEDFAKFKGAIRLSRFRLVKDKLDLSTEQQIIDVPVDRGICCHVGGDIAFDAKGNLYLSTGDDTNPFESDGYAPIDERPGRNPAYDAQRTAANTNDLRGKILRIKVGANGGYTVPAGNLFPAGTARTRPEIYLMGLRNPFRIELNRQTDELYVADYSPDAGQADPLRGQPGTASGRPSARPATTDGPTAPPRSCRTWTTTSPPASPGNRSTARRRSMSRRTTPGCGSFPRLRSRTCGTATAPRRSSRSWGPAASDRWPVRRTSSSLPPRGDAHRWPGPRTTTARRCSTSGPGTT